MYYKEVDKTNIREMVEFIQHHFTYWVLNPWNQNRSIANNVKIYNIPEIKNKELALQVLEKTHYTTLSEIIYEWKEDNPDYIVYFNGRSGGYLVLAHRHGNQHVLSNYSCSPHNFKDYESWKEELKEGGYGNEEEYKKYLIEEVELIQSFDQLCDELVEEVNYLIDEEERTISLTKPFKATIIYQRYVYPSKQDFNLHKVYMTHKGYHLYEADPNELWAEYAMCETADGEVILDYEGEEGE